MLPNDDTYGVWASSGEIDVMETRGRIPNASSGAIHYGGTWPTNTYLGGDYVFPEGESINSDYHVYSLVWEEDNIKWYVDGKCFFKATNDQWYSAGNPNNPNAPFDQEFYIIMNLAVGGWFDGGVTLGEGDIPASMNVDYVRVYQAEGSTNGSYTDNITEAAYGKQYEIFVSTDGVNYTRVINQSKGAGGVETLNIDKVKARYVKFQGIERALPYGYSLWDIKVMGQ